MYMYIVAWAPRALQGAWVFCCLFGVFFVCVFLFLFDDWLGWGGVGWDVNVHVHVTLKLFHG